MADLWDLAYPDGKSEESAPKISVFDDLKGFLTKQCGLKTRAWGRSRNGESAAWLDWREGSMCRRRWEFFLKPLPPGKWGRMLLESRGAGKSMAAKCLSLGEIADCPETILHYTAQNKNMSPRAVKWVKGKIQRWYPHLVPPIAERSDWGSQHFTVTREQGEGDNPTMLAGAPDADVTGSRPDKVWGDDLVVKETNDTYEARSKIIRWFEIYQDQFHAGTEVNLIGTRNEGHNLYEEIIKHYADYFVILLGDCYDDEMELNYPWMTREYLERQERKNPRLFDMQFRNRWRSAEGAIFSDLNIVAEDPPMVEDDRFEGGKRLDPRLNVFMLCDPAQSVAADACEWAFIVIAKDYEDVTYVVDIDIGKFDPAGGAKRYLEMYGKWIPHGLQYGILEDRGPALDLLSLLPELAALKKKNGEIDFLPALVKIKRGSVVSKNSRIDKCHTPFSEGRMRFSPTLIPKTMFRVHQGSGKVSGVAVERIRGFSPTGDTPRDFMDALADSQGILVEGKNIGPACPNPHPPRSKQRKKLTDQEWAIKRALGQTKRVHII